MGKLTTRDDRGGNNELAAESRNHTGLQTTVGIEDVHFELGHGRSAGHAIAIVD